MPTFPKMSTSERARHGQPRILALQTTPSPCPVAYEHDITPPVPPFEPSPLFDPSINQKNIDVQRSSILVACYAESLQASLGSKELFDLEVDLPKVLNNVSNCNKALHAVSILLTTLLDDLRNLFRAPNSEMNRTLVNEHFQIVRKALDYGWQSLQNIAQDIGEFRVKLQSGKHDDSRRCPLRSTESIDTIQERLDALNGALITVLADTIGKKTMVKASLVPVGEIKEVMHFAPAIFSVLFESSDSKGSPSRVSQEQESLRKSWDLVEAGNHSTLSALFCKKMMNLLIDHTFQLESGINNLAESWKELQSSMSTFFKDRDACTVQGRRKSAEGVYWARMRWEQVKSASRIIQIQLNAIQGIGKTAKGNACTELIQFLSGDHISIKDFFKNLEYSSNTMHLLFKLCFWMGFVIVLLSASPGFYLLDEEDLWELGDLMSNVGVYYYIGRMIGDVLASLQDSNVWDMSDPVTVFFFETFRNTLKVLIQQIIPVMKQAYKCQSALTKTEVSSDSAKTALYSFGLLSNIVDRIEQSTPSHVLSPNISQRLLSAAKNNMRPDVFRTQVDYDGCLNDVSLVVSMCSTMLPFMQEMDVGLDIVSEEMQDSGDLDCETQLMNSILVDVLLPTPKPASSYMVHDGGGIPFSPLGQFSMDCFIKNSGEDPQLASSIVELPLQIHLMEFPLISTEHATMIYSDPSSLVGKSCSVLSSTQESFIPAVRQETLRVLQETYHICLRVSRYLSAVISSPESFRSALSSSANLLQKCSSAANECLQKIAEDVIQKEMKINLQRLRKYSEDECKYRGKELQQSSILIRSLFDEMEAGTKDAIRQSLGYDSKKPSTGEVLSLSADMRKLSIGEGRECSCSGLLVRHRIVSDMSADVGTEMGQDEELQTASNRQSVIHSVGDEHLARVNEAVSGTNGYDEALSTYSMIAAYHERLMQTVETLCMELANVRDDIARLQWILQGLRKMMAAKSGGVMEHVTKIRDEVAQIECMCAKNIKKCCAIKKFHVSK